MSVRAVCFDLGGVLVQIHHTWEGALRAAGFDEVCREPERELSRTPAIHAFQAGEIDSQDYCAGLCEFLGLDTPEESLRVHANILRAPYPGTMQLIQDLESEGVATGCLSNTNEPHWIEMLHGERFPNVSRLQHRIASHEVRLFKPNPAIYRVFEGATGCSGSEIAFFDDSADNVVAARLLGWLAWEIDPHGDTSAQMRAALEEVGALKSPRLV